MLGDDFNNGPEAIGRFSAVFGLIAFQAAAIGTLHRLGSFSWMTIPCNGFDTWLTMAPIEDVVAALLRSIALVIAYWMSATTAAYGLARASRIPRLIKATAWVTLPPIRRVIDRAVAVTITAATLSAPIGPALAADVASQPPPTAEPIVYEISDQGVPIPVNVPDVDPTAVTPPGVNGAGYTPSPAGGVVAGAAAPATIAETVHEVIAGDNLWTIATDRLRSALPEHEIGSAEIATYWRRVIEINTPQLRSGDPNLIYPGEQIQLPQIDPKEST